MSDAGVRTSLLNVVVSSGIVDLWGLANSQEEKDAARVAVESIPGAKEVCDNTSVLPANIQSLMWAE